MSDTEVTRREARALDRGLAGEGGHGDPDGLLATAAELRAMFDFEPPTAHRERAMFVSGVSTRHHRFNPLRVMVPALAFLALMALAYLGGRTALPGDSLYPVRKALGTVGLAQSPTEEIDARLGEAGSLLSKAERSLDENPGTSLRLAVLALEELGPAIELLDELKGNDLETRTDAIDALESRAVEVIGAVSQVGSDDGRGDVESSGSSGSNSSGSSDGDDDRSGSNSGSGNDDDRSGDDDNSGRNDGDGDNSNSGPGSGDDDRSGSNSGSGSGDGDDNSGPGGGGDDNSGSGSGDDDDDPELPDVDEGRDGDDDDNSNSGPGGGDDDDRDELDLDGDDNVLR